MFYCLVNFVLGLAARARTRGRVTSGTRLGPLGNVHPLGAKCTRRARRMTPKSSMLGVGRGDAYG